MDIQQNNFVGSRKIFLVPYQKSFSNPILPTKRNVALVSMDHLLMTSRRLLVRLCFLLIQGLLPTECPSPSTEKFHFCRCWKSISNSSLNEGDKLGKVQKNRSKKHRRIKEKRKKKGKRRNIKRG